MKFKNLHIKNFCSLIPGFACDQLSLAREIDACLGDFFELHPNYRPSRWDRELDFWVEVTEQIGGLGLRVCTPECDTDRRNCGLLIVDVQQHMIQVPLNAMLRGSDELDDKYCVYMHCIGNKGGLSYIGITKNTWHKRLSQHKTQAASGSHLLFHKALRENATEKLFHVVLIPGVWREKAYELEEEFVQHLTLYPLGLNMIPGGLAGIRYLASLGFKVRGVEDRDATLKQLAGMESIKGRSNPLCASRWGSDQEYVNRVVCWHSGRLTVDQVRSIRMLSSSGYAREKIAEIVGDQLARVDRVLSGNVYARVA